MTTIGGHDVLPCPACGAPAYRTVYNSWNNFGWRVWSDGFQLGWHFGGDTPLRQCPCGQLFSVEGTAGFRYVRDIATPRHHWWQVWRPRRPAEPPTSDQLGSTLLNAVPDPSLELTIRRHYRWSLNNGSRPALLPDEQDRLLQPPTVGPTEHDNLTRLADLLREQPDVDWLELGDIYRSLGRFEEAIDALDRVPRGLSWAGRILSQAAQEERNGVLLLGA